MIPWIPPLLWGGVLFGLSSIPGQDIPNIGFSFSDKVAHCLVYGVLGALCFRALRLTSRLRIGATVLAVAAIALAFGTSDEIHQMFVPQRSSDVLDGVADVIGGTIGALIASRLSWLRGRA